MKMERNYFCLIGLICNQPVCSSSPPFSLQGTVRHYMKHIFVFFSSFNHLLKSARNSALHNVAHIRFQVFKQKVIRQMSFSSLSLYRSTQICSNCHFDFIIEEVRVEMYTLHNDVKRAKWLWKFGTNAKVDERWGEIDNITSNNFDYGLDSNNGQIYETLQW